MRGVLLLAPPQAVALSILGSGSLKWSAMTMTGIDFTLSGLSQGVNAQVIGFNRASDLSVALGSTVFIEGNITSNDWGAREQAVALPSIGSATSSVSATKLSESVSLLSNYTYDSGNASRNVVLTALHTGVLTVSIPYRLESHVHISGDWSFYNAASLQFSPCHAVPPPALTVTVCLNFLTTISCIHSMRRRSASCRSSSRSRKERPAF